MKGKGGFIRSFFVCGGGGGGDAGMGVSVCLCLPSRRQEAILQLFGEAGFVGVEGGQEEGGREGGRGGGQIVQGR